MSESGGAVKTILVAEGLSDSRMFMRMALEGHGYRVLEAESGEEAVEVALRERPDLILMDLHLPGLDALEATRRLRAHAELGGVPVVGTSTSDSPEMEAVALAAGCTAFRRQPIDFDRFGDLADLILGRTAGAERGGTGAGVAEAKREVEGALREIEHALVDMRHLAEQLSAGSFAEYSRAAAVQHLGSALDRLNRLSGWSAVAGRQEEGR